MPWQRRYTAKVIAVDATAVLIAAVGAKLLRFGLTDAQLYTQAGMIPYALVVAALIPTWLAVMAIGGCYDGRIYGSSSEEFRRLISAGINFFAAIALLHFLIRFEIARGFVAASVPAAIVLTVMGRVLLRKHLHRSRAKGENLQRVLLVGTKPTIEDLARHLAGSRWAGFEIAGVCSTQPDEPHGLNDDEVLHVVGGVGDVRHALRDLDVDTIVVADASVFPDGALRRLSWELEESGVELVVAPAVTDIAGPRISTRPVAGLPLLHIEQPRFSLGGRFFKAIFDRVIAAGVLLVTFPLLLVAAELIKLTSRGPIFYRQQRIGRDGESFTFLKLRSMVHNADELRAGLDDQNEAEGAMFKIREDPRITLVGRVLRRMSLDELPQLVHVLSGKMSLVGPRPPLPEEVAQYEKDIHRRLLVKPGITGLWQINGRADLSWDESVRLDLHYVDHWSPAMDIAVLLRTFGTVLRGKGAY